MKLLLINPPQAYNKGELPFVVFPTGLGYLASVLRENNFDITVLDCLGEGVNTKTDYLKDKYTIGLNFSQISNKIKEINPNIALISCSSSVQYSIVSKIAKIVKKINKGIITIVGGHHVSAMPKEVLKQDFDYVIIGEGEIPILNLMDTLSKKEDFENIKSVCRKKNNKIIINKELNLVKNLDTLPFPARDLFPFEAYISSRYKHSMLETKRRAAEVITSRGCPYGCDFCASNLVSGKNWRGRSVGNIILEIRTLIKKYSIEEIHFIDDNIIIDVERFKRLCRELIKLNIKWTVPNGISAGSLDKAILELMKESGCYALFIPVETGNKTVLYKYIKKDVDKNQIKSIITLAHKMGFYQVGFFLIGFYEETKEDIKETIRFASSLELDEAHFSIVTPLPGSEYYKQVKKLIRSYDYHSSKNANIDAKHLKKKDIETLRNKAYIQFELNKMFRRPLSYFDMGQIRRLQRYVRYFILNRL